jgi:hypothetical protein
MTTANATRRAIEARLSDALDALIRRDARIAATVLRVSGDRALLLAVEEDQRADQEQLFNVLLALRELRGAP